MNLLITLKTIPDQFTKLVVDEERVPHQWYVKGRDMWVRVSPLLGRTFTDERIEEMRASGFTVEEVKELKTNERVALFCRLYEQYKKVKYHVSQREAGMMGTLRVSESLLRYYLDDETLPDNSTTWLWRGKQSIPNLVKYQNEVRASMSAPAPSRHPNHWSAEHLRKLDGAGITEYHRHLKSLGLVAKKAKDGTIIDYVTHGTE